MSLPKVTHNLLHQYMGYAYEYDAQGNTVVKRPRVSTVANEEGTLTFAYDAENRMTTAVRTFATSRIVARYSYDAFGRRIAKRVDEQCWAEGETPPAVGQAHTGVLTLFVWDGDVMVQEVHADKTITYVYEPDSFVPLARVESAGGIDRHVSSGTCERRAHHSGPSVLTNEDGNPNAWHAHLDDSAWHRHELHSGKFLNVAKSEAVKDDVFYYRCDHLGTRLELVDSYGAVAWAVSYRPWGRASSYVQRAVAQPLRFPGQYEDRETGLYYNRHRYYDADAGRFVTQDPVKLLGRANPYQYASNLISWIDSLGLTKCSLAYIFKSQDKDWRGGGKRLKMRSMRHLKVLGCLGRNFW